MSVCWPSFFSSANKRSSPSAPRDGTLAGPTCHAKSLRAEPVGVDMRGSPLTRKGRCRYTFMRYHRLQVQGLEVASPCRITNSKLSAILPPSEPAVNQSVPRKRILFVEQNRDGTVGGSHFCLLDMLANLDGSR